MTRIYNQPQNADRLYLIEEAAERLRVPVGTMREWRLKGIGPVGARIGKRVMYRRSDLDAFLTAKFAEAAK